MKILIAYDGSSCSDSALDDLQKAGLPDTADALILSVAEIWLPPPPDKQGLHEYAEFLQTEPQPFKAYMKGGRLLSEAEAFAKHAEKRVKQNFPNWNVSAETSYGSPAWEILTAASNFGADLIVVGSQGRTALGRIWLGSISTRVLTEANQSVRVARGRIEVDPSPTRIVIGFDGSEGSRAAVKAVLARNWPALTEIRLIAATNHVLPAAIGRFVEPVADWVDNELKAEREWIENIAEGELKKLNDAGMKATLHTCAGNPKQVLVEESQKWGADCIFVGATASPSRVERFLLGSTAAAVAERSPCSVEAIRI
ncbi:MAG: universal stress protein [Pyrinomonadaceae bacterium]